MGNVVDGGILSPSLYEHSAKNPWRGTPNLIPGSTAPTNFHFFAKLKQRVLLHFCLSDRSANNKGMDSEHIVIVQYVHDYVRFVSYAPRGQLLLGFGPFPKWVCHPLSVDSKKKGLRYIMSYTRVFYHCFWTSCMRTYLVSWYMGTCCNQWQDTAHKLLVPGIKAVSYTHLTLPTIYSV